MLPLVALPEELAVQVFHLHGACLDPVAQIVLGNALTRRVGH
jgi:hypothetical protein